MRTGGRRAAATIVAAGTLALLPCGVSTSPAAAANDDFGVLVGGTRTGQMDLFAVGPYRSQVDLFEWVAGRRQLVRSFPLDSGFIVRNGRELGQVLMLSFSRWRCDRRTRTFIATATTTTGSVLTSDVSQSRTPSCARRLTLAAPRRARPGGRIKTTVSDSWKLGGQSPRLCLTPPGRSRASCSTLRMPAGKTKASRRLLLDVKGRWRLELRTSYQRTRRTIAVGVSQTGSARAGKSLLLLGDSMMAQLVTPINDALGSKARTDSLLWGGGRLTSRAFDWHRAARRRLAQMKPKVAAMLIGGSEGFPLPLNGVLVPCCGEAWIDAYAKRAAAMMRTLRRGGKTRVVWVLYPAPESQASREIQAAVNAAGIRAAARVRGVALADLNPAISPGFVYREYADIGGRRVKLRMADGVHFTLRGAGIAAAEVLRTARLLR